MMAIYIDFHATLDFLTDNGRGDFSTDVITVRFEADEIGSPINDVFVQVPIFNDGIEEAIEEVFVIDLTLNSSINSQISIIRRSSLCRINDDDGECKIIIGYLHSSGIAIVAYVYLHFTLNGNLK